MINGKIQTALTAINKVRSAINKYYQDVVWPVALINQARALVTQMIGQYRGLMQSIFSINLKSATLPNPIGLENIMRNHATGDFASLATSFGKHVRKRAGNHRSQPCRSHDDGYGRCVGDGQLQDAEGERLGR